MQLGNFGAGKTSWFIDRDVKERIRLCTEQNQCRRCGENLLRGSDLWCERCRKLVDEEFRGETSRPFNFYFEWYNKGQKLTAATAEKKLRKKDKEQCA